MKPKKIRRGMEIITDEAAGNNVYLLELRDPVWGESPLVEGTRIMQATRITNFVMPVRR